MKTSFIRLGALACVLGVAACDAGGTTEPDAAGPPTTVTLTAGAGQTAQVGTAVAVAPAVRVTDANGKPVPNIPVPFVVSAGGGTVSGTPATTDADGVARITSWTLGTKAGVNELTIGVVGLTAVKVTATGLAGPAAVITKVQGDAQTGVAGAAVAVRPAVKVEDAAGNALAGVTVTFAAGANSGTITAGTATTDSAGVARVGSWTLGAIGSNTLTATVAGLPTVSFTATATDPCARAAYTIGSMVQGSLTLSDCVDTSYGVRSDQYNFTLASQTDFTVTMNAPGFRGSFDIEGVIRTTQTAPGVARTARILLPAGTYRLRALQPTPAAAADTGAYTLSSSLAASGGCSTAYTVRAVTVSGTVATGDCISPFNASILYDQYAVYLKAGERVTGSLSANGSFGLEVRNAAAELMATGTATSVSFTATVEGYYYVPVLRFNTTGSGAYTLTLGQ